MNTTLIKVSILALVIAVCNSAHAYRPGAITLDGGVSGEMATGSFSNILDVGHRWHFGAAYCLNEKLSVGVEFGKGTCPSTELLTKNYQYELEDQSAQVQWQNQHYNVYSKVLFFSSAFSPYIKGGIGQYSFSMKGQSIEYGSETYTISDLGYVGAFGLQLRLGESASSAIEVSRTSMTDVEFGPLSIIDVSFNIATYMGGN